MWLVQCLRGSETPTVHVVMDVLLRACRAKVFLQQMWIPHVVMDVLLRACRAKVFLQQMWIPYRSCLMCVGVAQVRAGVPWSGLGHLPLQGLPAREPGLPRQLPVGFAPSDVPLADYC